MTDDDVKAANAALVESMVQQLRDCVSVGDEMTLDHATLIDDAADWIAGESARIAAEREEQREADARFCPNCLDGGSVSDTKSTQLRVADGYARLVVDAGGRSWRVALDHTTGGAEPCWQWRVISDNEDDGVLLAGSEPTWAAALRKAFRAAERAALEAA